MSSLGPAILGSELTDFTYEGTTITGLAEGGIAKLNDAEVCHFHPDGTVWGFITEIADKAFSASAVNVNASYSTELRDHL